MTVATTVRKAVFPVAGLGTRFLPATKASPKEMLPLVDKPLIQYVVEEAVAIMLAQIADAQRAAHLAPQFEAGPRSEFVAGRIARGHGTDARAIVAPVVRTREEQRDADFAHF